jgi:energy-coupling factor transporter ATP-binding protein EcfA2
MMLFLDEPTSGLDSTSALKVVTSLLTLLPLNITIAAVVHQPREEVFNAFDRLLLLSAGGQTVFAGKRDMMVPYFQHLGFQFDSTANPADQVLVRPALLFCCSLQIISDSRFCCRISLVGEHQRATRLLVIWWHCGSFMCQRSAP